MDRYLGYHLKYVHLILKVDKNRNYLKYEVYAGVSAAFAMLGIIFGITNELTDENQKLNEQKPEQIEILSAFYGYSNCLGLDSEAEIIANGCVYGYDESGKFTSNVPSRSQVRALCGKMFVIRFQKSLNFKKFIDNKP